MKGRFFAIGIGFDDSIDRVRKDEVLQKGVAGLIEEVACGCVLVLRLPQTSYTDLIYAADGLPPWPKGRALRCAAQITVAKSLAHDSGINQIPSTEFSDRLPAGDALLKNRAMPLVRYPLRNGRTAAKHPTKA